ncbi:MAG: CDP-alcohol phosphatidyltransferase family protein [Rhodothermales bacterium]
MSNQHLAQDAPWSWHLGQFWTVANMLSLFRGVLVIPITYLILKGATLLEGAMGTWLFGLMAFAILTDWLDGQLARWSHTVSDWGKVLDPLADKFAAVAVTLALVLRPEEVGPQLPLWFLALVVARDTAIVLGCVLVTRRTGLVLMSIWWGKVAVTALAITVLAALMDLDDTPFQVLIWITTALMLYAFVLYLVRFVRIWRTKRPPDEQYLQSADAEP